MRVVDSAPRLDTDMLAYADLAQDVSQALPDTAVFLSGLRCVAEVNLTCHRIGRVATSPVDILTELLVEIQGETTQNVILYPGHLEKLHRLGADVSARSVWFAASDSPCFAVWFTVENCSTAAYSFEISCVAHYNVNYISKFRIYPNDTALLDDDQLIVRDTRFPHLHAITAMNPIWDRCTIEVNSLEPSVTPQMGKLPPVRATWTQRVEVPAGASSTITLGLGGSNREGVASEAVRAVLSDPARAFSHTLATWQHRTTDGAVIQTPHRDLDVFYLQSKLWGYKDARTVPLGEPYDLERNNNADLVALTASPDYHGLFANDNAQSCLEYGAVGPAFYPVLDNTLEILYRFGTPESVEVDPVEATGRPWCSPLRIGERPQWVMGACALILWSGKYLAKYWPRIQNVLAGFKDDDRDGDWLDDYSNSPFPEQPDPGRYQHEMLYANVFWFQAFYEASKVARLAGDTGLDAEYRTSSRQLAQAIEARFGADHGYASWLDEAHAQHPHRGHNSVLPLQYGLASPERAEVTFGTLLSEPLWSDDGPLAIEPAYPLAGGGHAWAFMRWNLVQALYRYGRVEQATALLRRWAEQESQLLFQAPEGFPTITGVTGKGYSWTAGRAQRAILFGLFGLELLAHGFVFTPRLPSDWPSMSLRGFPFRGATYDVLIERGSQAVILLDGRPLAEPHIPAPRGSDRHTVVVRIAE